MSERWKPSVTVAAIAGRPRGDETEYLLVEEETPEGLRLNNPAGHLDRGESLEQAVVREALEETARAFVPEVLVGIYLARFERPATGEDVTYVRFAYAGRVSEPDPALALDHGIVRTLWMTLAELRGCRPHHRSALVLRGVEDAAAGRRFDLGCVVTDASVVAPEVKR